MKDRPSIKGATLFWCGVLAVASIIVLLLITMVKETNGNLASGSVDMEHRVKVCELLVNSIEYSIVVDKNSQQAMDYILLFDINGCNPTTLDYTSIVPVGLSE